MKSSLKKILLVGKLDGENVNAKACLIETKLFDVDLVNETQTALAKAQEPDLSMVIFSVSSLSPEVIKVFTHLRDLGLSLPILAIVKTVRSNDFQELDSVKAINVLQQPFKEKDLIWHAKEMSKGNHIQQRAHPRFYVNYDCKLDAVKENVLMSVALFNYSLGGACVIASAGPDLKKGDQVRLTINFKSQSGERLYKAQVVWSETVSKVPKKQFVGLAFTKQ